MKNFPMIRSSRAALVGALAVSLPMLILSLSPLTGVYAVLFVLYLLPVALCTVGMVCGALPMLISAAAGLVSMHMLLGSSAVMLAAVYVLPIVAAFAAAVSLNLSFKRSAPLMIGVHIAALAAAYLLLQKLAGYIRN